MPWVRIDEEFPRHPKVVKAGPLGMAMHVAALCYCNQYLTDGFVPKSVAAGLLDLDGIGMRQWMGELTGGGEDATWQLVVQDLETAGLWERAEGGWRIHDYHDYQPSREHVLKVREVRKDAGRKGGQAKGKQVAKQSPTKRQAKAEAESNPVPVPVPPVGTGGTEASPGEIPQASPTARVASATEATITPIPTAQTFVAAYVDAYRGRAGHDPPARVKGQVAKHLREAFTDGISTEHVKAGFVEWFEDNKHPATLPSYIEIAGRNGQSRSRPTSRLLAEDAKLAHWANTMKEANQMQPNEWRHIVARLAANYPGQALPAETATDWFGPLAQFPATEVWDAVDRHRRDITPGRDGRPLGAWLPSLAGIMACIDANWREAAAGRRELEARQAKATHAGAVAYAPPELDEIRGIIEAAKGLPGEPGHMLGKTARDRVQALIDQHNERVDLAKRGELL